MNQNQFQQNKPNELQEKTKEQPNVVNSEKKEETKKKKNSRKKTVHDWIDVNKVDTKREDT